MTVQNFMKIVWTVFEKFEIFIERSGEKDDCISSRKFFRLLQTIFYAEDVWLLTRQKRPKYEIRSASVISALIRGYMGFADSFPPPTFRFSLKLNEFFFHFKSVY